jgi:hypothetical protein
MVTVGLSVRLERSGAANASTTGAATAVLGERADGLLPSSPVIEAVDVARVETPALGTAAVESRRRTRCER